MPSGAPTMRNQIAFVSAAVTAISKGCPKISPSRQAARVQASIRAVGHRSIETAFLHTTLPSRWLGVLTSRAKIEGRRNLGAVAQLGEHLVCNQGVVGSNPIRSIPHLSDNCCGPAASSPHHLSPYACPADTTACR